MWRAWVNFVVGIWVFISAFWLALVAPWNFFISGLIIAVFGFTAYRSEWQGYINGVLGLWLMASAFFVGLAVPWNMLITGAIVAALAFWRAMAPGPIHREVPHAR